MESYLVSVEIEKERIDNLNVILSLFQKLRKVLVDPMKGRQNNQGYAPTKQNLHLSA